MFLLHLTRQLAPFRSCCPKPAPAGCPAAKEGGRGVLLLSQGSLSSFRREREAAAGHRAGGTRGTAGGLERSCSRPPHCGEVFLLLLYPTKTSAGRFSAPKAPQCPLPSAGGCQGVPRDGHTTWSGAWKGFFGKRSLKTEKVGGDSGHGAKSTPKLLGFAGVIPRLHHSQPADAPRGRTGMLPKPPASLQGPLRTLPALPGWGRAPVWVRWEQTAAILLLPPPRPHTFHSPFFFFSGTFCPSF